MSLVSIFIAAAVFLYGALAYVATDATPSFSLGSDSDLSKPNDITIHVTRPGSTGDIYLLRLEFPKNVPRGDDFTIHLQIMPLNSSPPSKNLEATIHATNTIKFWNTQPCESDKSDGAKSCGTLDGHTNGIDYYWTATASGEGERTMTVV